MKYFLTPALLIAFVCTALAGAPGQFEIEIDLHSHADDAFHVTMELPELSADDGIFSFVAYAPGVHQPLNYGRFVKSLYVYDDDGNELVTQKLNTNDWKILAPEQAAVIKYVIDDSYDMSDAEELIYPMSGTAINDEYAVLNTFGLFAYFHNLKDLPIRLSVVCDPAWEIGTALSSDSTGALLADSYYHLADSPILAGKLTIAKRQIGDMSVEAYVFSPTEKITADIVMEMSETILNSAYTFIGFSPVDRYTFLMYFHDPREAHGNPVLRASGALEHSYSSTYALPAMPEYLPILSDVIAHEFMHILTPLNLRSEIIANFDYTQPNSEDKHLWLYEGVTEWVAHYMQLYSGDITPEDYLDRLSGKIRNSEHYGCTYSLARLSSEWSTEEGNKNYGNIYQLGALTASALNVKLLELSGGQKGLRDVYIEMIRKYGKDKPFDNDTFFEEFVSATYPEVAGFFDQHIEECSPFDYAGLYESLGITYTPEKVLADEAPVFGTRMQMHDGKFVIVGFSENYRDFGLKKGDAIIRVFGQDVTPSNYSEVFANKDSMDAGDTYEMVVLRNGEEVELEGTLVDKMDYHVFELTENPSKKQKKLRQAWLGPGKSGS